MSKIRKRLENLEAKTEPQKNMLVVIRYKDESEEEALAREGLTQKDIEEAAYFACVRFV